MGIDDCTTLSVDELRIIFKIQNHQQTIIQTIGSLSVLISIFNVSVLINVKTFQEPPSDILLLMNVFSIVKFIVMISTIIYQNNNDQSSDNFNSFCISTGFFDVLVQTARAIYAILFCLYYLRKIKNPLKIWVNKSKQIHIFCWFLIILITFVLYFTQSIGFTILGYCGIKSNQITDFGLAGVGIGYTFILLSTSIIFLKYIKKIAIDNERARHFFRYYTIFLIIYTISQITGIICKFIIAKQCHYHLVSSMSKIAKVVSNTISLSFPLFSLAILMTNQNFHKVMFVKLIRDLCQKLLNDKNDRNIQQRSSFYADLLTTGRTSIEIQLQNLSHNQGYLKQIKNKNRACFLATLLGCLSMEYQQINQRQKSYSDLRTSTVQQQQDDIFQWNFQEVSSFTLSNSITSYYNYIFLSKVPAVVVKIISYASNILIKFMKLDGIDKVHTSLLPIKNWKQIVQDSKQIDGGRSGHFFFFNAEHTLLLKTVSQTQRKVYLQRLFYFYQHYRTHPKSFIIKLYKIFTVVNQDTNQQIHFSLMGNITKKINKKYIIRSYDLKGSTHSRKILQQFDNQDQYISKTLKDIDFLKLQQKIWVEKQDADLIKQIIRCDANFLKQQELIDYSLIVMKLNLQKIMQDHHDDAKILQQLLYFKSTKQQHVIYVFSIIDYLQTWNIRKKGQKWYKSLFNNKRTISSQDPEFYQVRFFNFISNILTN